MASRLYWSKLAWVFILAFVVAFAGCEKGTKIDAEVLATSQEAYDNALVEIEGGNSEAALELLDVALQPGGGLTPDIHADARVQRAVVRARLDQLEDAHADLDVAEQGAADMSAVYVARSYVFSKEGKSKESKAEMSKAKKLRRGVKAIRD